MVILTSECLLQVVQKRMPFDVDIFISEISLRRPLWDIALKDYNNRDVKSKLWVEVAGIVIDNWDQLPKRRKK